MQFLLFFLLCGGCPVNYTIILRDTDIDDRLTRPLPSERSNFYPFSLLHPSFELRCGALRLFEKTRRRFPKARFLVAAAAPERETHLDSFVRRFGGKFGVEKLSLAAGAREADDKSDVVLAIAGNAYLPEAAWIGLQAEIDRRASAGSAGALAFHDANGVVLVLALWGKLAREAAWSDILAPSSALYSEAERTPLHTEARALRYLWDALALQTAALEDDARFFTDYERLDAGLSQRNGVFALDAEKVMVGVGAHIAPCVVLDASKGAIIIGENVEIQPHAFIVGPCYIGDNALVKAGARLYEGVSLGERSKVAGELKNTVLQGFANKQHDGCLGYSFIGEWVNLGAGTEVSDLKNNYGVVRAQFSHDKTLEISSGMTSLGLLAGDHTKTAINSSLTTGTVIGVSANVFDPAPQKYIASFAWGGGLASAQFEIEKALSLARAVMARRNQTLTPEEETLLRREFDRAMVEGLVAAK
jgi:UDP-N-acetylglucosamine diphosphorylase/glucosamine-1-phosphate N-acetyltransferase